MEKHSQKSEARGLSKGELARESTHNGGPVRGTPRERNLLDAGLQSAGIQEALVSDRVLSDAGQMPGLARITHHPWRRITSLGP